MTFQLLLIFLYFTAAAILIINDSKKKFRLLSSLKLSRNIYYTVIFCMGMLLGASKISAEKNYAFYTALSAGIILINLLFTSSSILNDFYDLKIDRINGKKNIFLSFPFLETNYIFFIAVLTAASLLIAAAISPYVFLCSLVIHVISWVYSCPPLRFKAVFPINAFLIGFSSAMALFCGFTVFAGNKTLFLFPYSAAISLFVVLSAAFTVKDINDFKGDSDGGIKTIPVIFGSNKGRKIIAILVLITYTLFPIMLNSMILVPAAFIFGGLTAVLLFTSKEKIDETLVFIYLFLFILSGLIICHFKGLGCIPGIY